MKGLELSRRFFEEFGKPLLQQIPGGDSVAAGLCGEGSECFGFDDSVSRDHDFGPAFDLLVPDTFDPDLRRQLEDAYRHLPSEFAGIGYALRTPQAADRHGVHSVGKFFVRFTGKPRGPETWQDYLYTPDSFFAAATNGEIFATGDGTAEAIRTRIRTGMPEDVRRKKIATRAFRMAQAGQYNYTRCHAHGEDAAAVLAKQEFAQNGCELIFLLNRRFSPFYKWMFRAARQLPLCTDAVLRLETLLVSGEDRHTQNARDIEFISAVVIDELRRQNLSNSTADYLEPHAHAVAAQIQNPEISALHLLEG